MRPETLNRVLLVDDDLKLLKSVTALLQEENYTVIACDSAGSALDRLRDNDIDVILTDIRMPDVSGIELLEQIRNINSQVPVILMTAYADFNVSVSAIKKGAFDFIIKPSPPDYLLNSLTKAFHYINFIRLKENYKRYLEDMVRKKTRESESSRHRAENFSRELVGRLTSVAEFRSTEAGTHNTKIGIFSGLIADALNMPGEFVSTIKQSSPLHDIGKIGVPDNILLKPSPLAPDEFEIMKAHTTLGEKLLTRSSHSIIQMAASIALTHHETWDGTGYPAGLKGKDIPIEGRIVKIADQYDAVRSKRVYKTELSHEETFRIITKGDGRTMPEHFDPEILNAFIRVSRKFNETYTAYSA